MIYLCVQVQEDLQHLRDELLQKSLAGGTRELVNIQLLENAIQKAEDGIKVIMIETSALALVTFVPGFIHQRNVILIQVQDQKWYCV